MKPSSYSSIARPISEQIDIVAVRHGLDPLLVAAIVQVESAGSPWAIRYEPAWAARLDGRRGQPGVTSATERVQLSTSWGLMQVLGVTARELGFKGPFLSALCAPAVGLEYGCRYLARQLRRYKGDVSDAIAAYNAGTARRRDDGTYVNEDYVRKVWRAMEAQMGGDDDGSE